MQIKVAPKKLILISVLTVVISLLTVVMGAPLLRMLRKISSAIVYWGLGVLVVCALILLGITTSAIFVGSIWVTLGVYSELEDKGFSWWNAGLLAATTGAANIGLFIYLLTQNGQSITMDKLNQWGDSVVAQVHQIAPNMPMDPQVFVMQIPSLIVIVLIFSLGISVIFEKKVFSVFHVQRERLASQVKLLDFKIPDFFIWIALGAALFALVDFKINGQKTIAMNILNIAIVLYFFQGLAILEVFLRALRAGIVTRFLTYVLLVGQMFVLVSIFGLVDYWIDFRRKIRKIAIKPSRIN